jgi:DHA2 family multidrug resistance protein
MLDKGQDADWFSSTFIRVLATGAALGFIVFVFWELKTPNPTIPDFLNKDGVTLRVLLDRNLAIGAALIFMAGAILNGTTAILPQLMQNLMNYTALQAGLVISPRGLGAIAGSLLAGYILSKVDWPGFYGSGRGAARPFHVLARDINLFIAPGNLLWPIILSGFAVAAIFVPITIFSVATVSRQQMGDATGLTNLLRNLGDSVGISLLTKLIAGGTQAHQDLMVGHLTPYDTPFRNQLAVLQH